MSHRESRFGVCRKAGWINYHWSQESGIYAGGQFDSIFDPKIIERTSDGARVRIKPRGQYDRWQTSELVSVEKAADRRHLMTARVTLESHSDLIRMRCSAFPPTSIRKPRLLRGEIFIAKSRCSRFCAGEQQHNPH